MQMMIIRHMNVINANLNVSLDPKLAVKQNYR